MNSVTKLPVKKESASVATTENQRHPLMSLRREIDRLFDDFFSTGWSPFPLGRRLLDQRLLREPSFEMNLPAVDIHESGQQFMITAELPGIDDKDIEVTVSDESITIKGEKKHEKDESGEGYQLSERSYGAFERTFGIPAGVDADRIAAEFAKGVLKLTLPKTPEAQQKQPKKIEVKAA